MTQSDVQDRILYLERKVNVLNRLADVSILLNTTYELDSLLTYLMDAAAAITDCEAASVLLWDEQQHNLRFAATTANQTIYWFDWSNDGTKVAVATVDGISVYDSSFHLLVFRPQPDPTGSRSFGSLSPDGSKLTSEREIWDTKTLETLHHFDSIYTLGNWSNDGKLVSTVGHDMKSILLYDTTTGELVKTIPTGNLLLTFNPVWSPDNTRFAITEKKKTVAIIDASNGQIIARYPYEELIDIAIAWSNDSKQIAYTGFLEPKPGTTGAEIKHSVFVTNLVTGLTLRVASDLPSDIWEFDWSRDDTQLLAVGSTEIYIWDMKHGQLVERYKVLTWPLHAEYSPFGGQIMMGFNLYWYKSSTTFAVQAATRSFLDGAIQIVSVSDLFTPPTAAPP